MRKLFFCARDIRDYLNAKIDISKLEKIHEFAYTPVVQKILFDLMKIYPHCEEYLEAPIYGETKIAGFRLDFNFGLRLDVPEENFHVRISDFDTGMIFFNRNISDVRLISFEKYFIRWQIEIFHNDRPIFKHVFNPEGYSVQIVLRERAALGDTLAMFPSIEEFRQRFKCRVAVIVPAYLKEIAAHLYPDLKIVDRISFENYAAFYLLPIISSIPYLPVDPRNNVIERMGSSILGLNTVSPKPAFNPTAQKICPEPYVCISVQASTPTKGWLYPGGWKIVVDYLKSLGYRVFCIDKKKFQREENYSITMPENAEDFTGDLPIMERANMLYHAEFFIGLSSGLSWLADAVNCPVVMICGFSQDWHEFYTPYRVANRFVCNGCFNDIRLVFTAKICPRYNATTRELECQKKFSPRQVIDAIERLIIDKNLLPPIFSEK